VRIEELYGLWKSGELATYEAAIAARAVGPADVDDELEPLEPVDRDLLLGLHRGGVDVTRAFAQSLRAHGDKEPRRVIRTFPAVLRLR
jgi:hypothetical protein